MESAGLQLLKKTINAKQDILVRGVVKQRRHQYIGILDGLSRSGRDLCTSQRLGALPRAIPHRQLLAGFQQMTGDGSAHGADAQKCDLHEENSSKVELKDSSLNERSFLCAKLAALPHATLALPMLRTVQATRYVLPLREGGSLPAIVEADDLGLYVVKFRGAGQGILALIAELIAGEIGRALGLRVPELVFAQIDPALGRNEPDAEIRHLLKSSAGLNLALDYLPGSTMFDPAARDAAPSAEASLLVWFDAFVLNVDRTPRNANLLLWHRKLYPIDHGAALFFHHNWPARESKIESPFMEIEHHILLRWANEIEEAARLAHRCLTPALLRDI